MQVVYEAANLIDAHLVRHALEAVEIPVYLRGEALLGGMGELPLFGLIAVCVPDMAWADARGIVEDLALGEPRAITESQDDEDDAPDWLPSPA